MKCSRFCGNLVAFLIISRHHSNFHYRNCLIKHPQDDDPDESVKDLVEIALRKLDIDKDGKVSYLDYTTAVKADGLLLEAFGQILPTDAAADGFLSTLQ